MSLQTRESSTLVIVTFLASTSLLLATISDDNMVFNDTTEIANVGFTFALVGLLYRQVTVWTIDRKEHNRAGDRYEKRNRRDEYYLYGGVREFLLLFFLSLPIAFWAHELWYPTSNYIICSGVIAFSLAVWDSVLRLIDRHRHIL